MNQEDIIRMAQEAGFEAAQIDLVRRFAAVLGDFAAVVAAHEREECAKVCAAADKSTHPADLADSIRARGEK